MNLDIDKIHNILLEAGLPSTIDELKNPTEGFVVNLINTFLRRFCIDASVIEKPTRDQQEIMSYFENSDIIGLINLHTAMAQICDRIFLKDLCITDIISPGSKRVRKQAKFLANFILYATNKESDIQDRVEDIQSRVKMLQDLLDKKNEVRDTSNKCALHVAKQLSVKEKLEAEIKKIESRIEKNKKQYPELLANMKAAEEKKQKAIELCDSYKTQALKLSKTIAELQSEIVKSPEEYQMTLRELEEECKLKVKDREAMQEAFQDKKQLIEQKERTLNFLQKQLDKFPEIQHIHEELKNVSVQETSIIKQVEAYKGKNADFEMKVTNQKDQFKDNEVTELRRQCEERLFTLRNMKAELQSDKKMRKAELDKKQVHYDEESSKINENQCLIKKIEEETILLIKQYQECYDSEMRNEKDLWKTWMGE